MADQVGPGIDHALEIDAREAGRAAHGHQARNIRTNPVVELAGELRSFVKFHRRNGAGGLIVGDEGFDAGEISAEFADAFERQHRMLQVIENAEEQDDIEIADIARRQIGNVGDHVLDLRVEDRLGFKEMGPLGRIDGDDRRAAALHFEAEPAVPGADIEHSFAAQVEGDGELREPPALLLDALDSGDHGPVGQLNAVIVA